MQKKDGEVAVSTITAERARCNLKCSMARKRTTLDPFHKKSRLEGALQTLNRPY